MNRYIVLEAIVKDGKAAIAGLDTYSSFTAAYFTYPTHINGNTSYDRLWCFDAKRRATYDWQHVQSMMLVEQLNRVKNSLYVQDRILDILKELQMIDVEGYLTNKGRDHIAQYEIPEGQTIKLDRIASATRLRLRG